MYVLDLVSINHFIIITKTIHNNQAYHYNTCTRHMCIAGFNMGRG